MISGNTDDGVEITGAGTTGNVVRGQFHRHRHHRNRRDRQRGERGLDRYWGLGQPIGGTTASARNILSGNLGDGVQVNDASDNLVEGNYVGTDITGTAALGNNPSSGLGGGVTIDNGASGNTIGGLTATPGTGAGNVISANAFSGVFLYYAGPNNLVAGNLVGTDASGTVGLGNTNPSGIYGGFGVALQFSPDNIIGEPGGRNVISANGPYTTNSTNVSLYYSSGTVVQSNYIGTDITGSVALSVGVLNGVAMQYGSYTIGGLTPTPGAGLGNVISGNAIGIYDIGDTTYAISIEGNIVGADPTGEHPVSNRDGGIDLADVSLVTIGGTAAGAGNLISGNNDYGSPGGVYLYDGATQNVVEGNLIGTDITGLDALPDTLETEYGVLIASGASDNTIGGTTAAARNVISGDYGWGVGIDGSTTTGNLVVGNYIGTDLNGNAALGNAVENPQSIGVVISNAPGNTVGGTVAGWGNVISGNSEYGVEITDLDYVNQDTGTSATGNVVAGDYIGTDVTGTVAIANGTGVEIDTSASGNTIGGLTSTPGTGLGNVISGNTNDGVEIADSGTTGNVVAGNLIGLDAAGSAAIGNGNCGVETDMSASSNTIGGPTASARNIISGNLYYGVESGGGTVVQSNYIGTDLSGTVAIANLSQGVRVGGSSGLIGGATGDGQGNPAPGTAPGNVIAGNANNLVVTAGSSDYIIAGNLIGLNATGTAPLSFGGVGVGLSGDNITLGGMSPNDRNIITGGFQELSIGDGEGYQILNNYFGTDITGTIGLDHIGQIVSDGWGAIGVSGGATNVVIGAGRRQRHWR